jgi:hypothetical protein
MAYAQSAGGVGKYDADKKEMATINNVQKTNKQNVAKQEAAWTVPSTKTTTPGTTTKPTTTLSNFSDVTSFIKDYASGNVGVTMDHVVAAGKNNNNGFPDTNKPASGGGGGGGSSSSAAKPTYTAATLPSATSQESYINAMYDANAAKQKAALEAQYAANVGALDRQAAGIPAQYDAAANQAAAQSAVSRSAFNEMASASGLNTGATGQAALAQNNALLSSISAIRQSQAEALNDVESQRVALQQQYQAAIKEAIANNEADRAAALYNEAKRVDESLVSTAVNQATENYRAWQAMYK